MALTIEATAVSAAAALEDYDLIAVPVVSVSEQIRPHEDAAEVLGTLELLVDLLLELDSQYAARHRFEAKVGQTLIVSKSPGAPTILLVGLGAEPGAEQWRQAGAAAVRAARGPRALLAVVGEEASEAAALGGLLASYRFSLRSAEIPGHLEQLDLLGASTAGVARGRAIAGAVGLARDLVNRVPSELTPSVLADAAIEALADSPQVGVEVWDEARLAEERLGGILGVARGSHEAPRLVTATYEPLGATSTHVVLVGKGITFDSGGLSLKTAKGMITMKTDMTGAAVVLAAMTALADLEVPVKVTAIAPLAENMPGAAAMKPGDVLTPRNGTTIEVLNTDAEGRLILADGLSLAAELEPDLIVDVATLTGAAVVALGTGVGALLSNSDEAADAFLEASAVAGERLWRLPLVEEYESHIASDVADIKNTGAAGEAGTISAGLFLQHFVGETPWVHLDIAGPGRSEKEAGLLSKGGTAFSLRTILTYLRGA